MLEPLIHYVINAGRCFILQTLTVHALVYSVIIPKAHDLLMFPTFLSLKFLCWAFTHEEKRDLEH